MLELFTAFVVCLSVLQTKQVEAANVCPPVNVISPCTCIQQTATTTYLNCASNNLNNSQVSDILDAYLATADVSPVSYLGLYNNLLTRVPVQIEFFTQLIEATFYSNSISSIESGAFNLADDANPLQYLSLHGNQMTTIAPGAFKGSSNFIF